MILGLPPFLGGGTSIYPVTSCCPSFCVLHRPRVTPARPTSATPPPPAAPGGRSWLRRRWRHAPRRQRRPRRRPSVAGRGPDISLGKRPGMGKYGENMENTGKMLGFWGKDWDLWFLMGFTRWISQGYCCLICGFTNCSWFIMDLLWENKVLYYSCKTLRQERFIRFSGHLNIVSVFFEGFPSKQHVHQ